jgi:hypothetical protein
VGVARQLGEPCVRDARRDEAALLHAHVAIVGAMDDQRLRLDLRQHVA